MTIYEQISDETGERIKRENEDGTTSWIPIDPANSDYQRYLRWLSGEDEQSGTLS